MSKERAPIPDDMRVEETMVWANDKYEANSYFPPLPHSQFPNSSWVANQRNFEVVEENIFHVFTIYRLRK